MKHERGNILFLILLAVVLFAALSYAVTSSTNGGGKNASTETLKTQTASMLQFFDQVDAALLRMRMTKGLAPENISFIYNFRTYDNTFSTRYDNANCLSDECRVFRPDGGGIASRTFETYATAEPNGWTTTHTKPGYFELLTLQFPYAGTDLNDVVMKFVGMTPALCTAINAALDIPAAITVTGTPVSGNTPANWDNTANVVSGAQWNSLIGKSTFASVTGGTGVNAYCNIWHVVIAR